MIRYIINRLIISIFVFFGITVITFSVIHLAPGSPTDLATQLNPKVSLEVRERLNSIYGLDKPLWIQYLNWLKRFLRFDFGDSFLDGRPVIKKIAERLPITLLINILALLIILLVAIPIGVISAVRENSLFDKLTTLFVFVGFATPSFWLSLLLMSFIGVRLGWLPVSGIYSLEFDRLDVIHKIFDILRHLTLPVFVSAFGAFAGMSRYTKNSMLEVMQQDYIRTARAKGLNEITVVLRHGLRNALLPVITILGLSVPGLIGGSVIIETIFSIPGMGRLFYESVMARDYPTIMGILVLGAMLTLLGNLLADISYSIADPRIRVSKK